MVTTTELLSAYIEPIAAELTPQQAWAILSAKPSEAVAARARELAEKETAGHLSEIERAEYENYVGVDDVIGLLKLRARSVLQRSPL